MNYGKSPSSTCMHLAGQSGATVCFVGAKTNSVFEDDEEARTRIYPEYRLHAPYEGLRPGLFVDIDLVVVRDDRRYDGVGLEVLALLISYYPGQVMIAFSAADGRLMG